jgi:hypothetical protein
MPHRTRSLRVDLATQTLDLLEDGVPLRRYPVSTGLAGPGEVNGSGCTPRGLHRVRLRIGGGCTVGAVFVRRRPTGEVYCPDLATQFPGRDWILTSILWLTGLESGRNRGGDCDTLRRFVYIHGCADSAPMGVPLSHGCIRMRNADIVQLFDLVPNGTLVEIAESGGHG